jgi:uncharacterized protein YdaU (DUF1376 family)
VNFYKRFIGDIQAKTGGLTLAEFGAYDRLLDHYYSTEQPVPADEVYRICRAMSGAERTAVDKVLAKFFDLTPTGWAQSKADEQIAKALPLIEAARANGKKGGRPKKPKTQEEPSGFPNRTQEEPSSKATQSQSQIPSSQSSEGKPARKTRGAAPQLLSVDQLVAENVERQHAEDWLAVRAKKSLPLTRTAWDEVKAEAAKAGMSPAEAVRTAAGNTWGSFKAKWLTEATKPQQGGHAPHKHAAAAAGIFGRAQPSGEIIDV